ncbi:MAG: acetoacetate decarboxylase family protein [Nocardioides sp.]|uniref:acetoacetate decarboxylase family protein n=1 Tax=Nocardioides sp. TaxID=35761 RepID=UPI003EFCE40D
MADNAPADTPEHAPAYPPAPWHMHGQLWLSIVKVREAVDDLRPAGMYGVAMVDYQEPSPLTYGELLVGRVVKTPVEGVTITDIWVDSPASVAGGREIWAIPKELCDFSLEASRKGPLARTHWTMSTGGVEIATASFTDISRIAPRTPFKANTWQPGIEETGFEDRSSPLQGSAKALLAHGRWTFNPLGPLAWLHGSRTIASFRMVDFEMRVE